MNLKTTLVVAVLLLAAGTVVVLHYSSEPPRPPDLVRPAAFDLANLGRIEVRRGPDEVVLEGGPGREWSLPGHWPARPTAVQPVLDLLRGLASRFEPVPLAAGADLKPYGLDPSQNPTSVTIKSGAESHRLTFGEGDAPLASSPFTKPTFLRIDDQPEVLRLAPGLLTVLQASADHYRTRRLFGHLERLNVRVPPEPVPPQFGPPREEVKTVEVIDAAEVTVSGPGKRDAEEGQRLVGRLLECGDNPFAAALLLADDDFEHPSRFTLRRLGGPLAEKKAAERKEKKDADKGGNEIGREDLAANWEAVSPYVELLDGPPLEGLLSALPDVWAEKFVPPSDRAGERFGVLLAGLSPGEALSAAGNLGVGVLLAGDAYYGLGEPARVVTVKRLGGEPVTLLIGREVTAETKRPDADPDQPPAERRRYARLRGNPQVFEVNAERLDRDVFVSLSALRDPHAVRFKAADVTRIALTPYAHEDRPARAAALVTAAAGFSDLLGSVGAQLWLAASHKEPAEMVLAKQDGRWRMLAPQTADVEQEKVTALLDEVARVEARGQDVSYRPDAAAGLSSARLTLTLERQERPLVVHFTQTGPLRQAVRVEGRPRVSSVVTDKLLASLKDSPLAYRDRRLLSAEPGQLAAVEVQRGKKGAPGAEVVALGQGPAGWRLTQPVAADADAGQVQPLADKLAHLDAVEFVAAEPTPADLAGEYGLADPEMRVTVSFKDAGRRPEVLLIGKPRPGRTDTFARFDDPKRPEVFTVSKELTDLLGRNSLAYRPLQQPAWPAEEARELRVSRPGKPEYRLAKKDGAWRLVSPFDAAVVTPTVQPMVGELAGLKAERWEAHDLSDAEKYGLDRPAVKAVLSAAGPEGMRERALLIGKPVNPEGGARYAALDGTPGVFVVAEAVARDLDRDALDLLDKRLLSVNPDAVQKLRTRTAQGAKLGLQRHKDGWHVVESEATPFLADQDAVRGLLAAWSGLTAERYAAYGVSDDQLKEYGLDSPALTATVETEEGGKEQQHTLEIGKDAPSGGRYARLDRGPAVVVLSEAVAAGLRKTHLDFVNRTVLTFAPNAVTAVTRAAGPESLELANEGGSWSLAKPAAQRADDETVKRLLAGLAGKAKTVAAFPPSDAQLKEFGLDQPAAVLTLKLPGADGKPAELVLKVGKAVPGDAPEAAAPPDRYAQAQGAQTVVVLPGGLADLLLAPPVRFRNRKVIDFFDARKVELTRGDRVVTFEYRDGSWKVTAPLEAPAEANELTALLNDVAPLRAAEWVAEKPTEKQLQEYGLAEPAARWRFFETDKEVALDLLLGKRGKDPATCYAMQSGGDAVFLLGPDLTRRLFTEYRSRKVWAQPPNAAEVASLRYKRGQESFTLTKVAGTWTVAGRPGDRVKTEAVNDTLAALANLQVDHFAKDKDADPKLYKLDEPQVIIEVQVRGEAEKLVLELGDFEDKAHTRRYARVPQPGRTDVFVLSEADTSKLDRGLTSFAEPQK